MYNAHRSSPPVHAGLVGAVVNITVLPHKVVNQLLTAFGERGSGSFRDD
jgi:hypothetical protein